MLPQLLQFLIELLQIKVCTFMSTLFPRTNDAGHILLFRSALLVQQRNIKFMKRLPPLNALIRSLRAQQYSPYVNV